MTRTAFWIFFTLSSLANFNVQAAVSTPDYTTAHGRAIYGTPKYPKDFKHFDYVNPNAPRNGRVRLGLLGSYDTFELFSQKGIPAAVGAYIYDSLMIKAKDEPYTLYPLIAESVEYPEDNRWVRFIINSKARFSDGSPITAKAVAATFNHYKNSEISSFKLLLREIESIETEAGNKVKLTLQDPENKELPFRLSLLPIVPESYWKNTEQQDKTSTSIPVGSGPYTIKSYDIGHSVTLERVKEYWARDLPVNIGRHNFKEVKLEYFRNSTVSIEAFLSGGYDIRTENLAKNWTFAYSGPDIESGKIIKEDFPRKSFQVQSFIFNSRNKQLSDRRVREAISQGYDITWTNKNLLYNIYSQPYSLFATSQMGHRGKPSAAELKLLEPFRDILPDRLFTQEWRGLQSDGSGNIRAQLNYANQLLEQAGWIIKKGKRVHKSTGKPLVLELLLAVPEQERISIPFRRNLLPLGIDLKITSVDISQYVRRVREHDYDMLLRTFIQPDLPGNEQREYWDSENADKVGSQNLAGVNHPAVDAMIQHIIKASTEEQLITASRALDRILLWEHYVLPQLYHPFWRVAYRSHYSHPEGEGLFGPMDFSLWWENEKQ